MTHRALLRHAENWNDSRNVDSNLTTDWTEVSTVSLIDSFLFVRLGESNRSAKTSADGTNRRDLRVPA